MEIATGIGYAASVCSVASFVPQAIKIARTRDTGAISTRMYILTVTGFGLWTGFGLLRDELPIILANAACLCLSVFILAVKLHSQLKL
ncbi:MtN3 and saliva related transmembrane protein [Rhizobium sp. BK650]|uniref:SemiSWEET family sugar transporter n=1 Tax=Rhizobium sp. BK650 TaxID=2586990 RepID=UPI0016195E9D|nr:SemiSWEET transporter [Rhizobium sp. BK650]MBB3660781.1 MtN3 and saliva related transmembrane protein [Rhizobium sp. BK650]